MQTFCLFLLLIFAAVLVFGVWKCFSAVHGYLTRSSSYDALILTASRRNGVDPALVKAVIWRESRFDRFATGKAGEVGLMQIMPDQAVRDWARAHRLAVPSRGALFSPDLNIEIGSWYLANAVRRWSPWKDGVILALCEYNAGPRRAMLWKTADPNGDVRSRIAIASTLSYVDAVVKRCQEYRNEEFGKMPQKKEKKGKK